MKWFRRLVNKGNVYFAVNWARIPFQPILFAFLFFGAILVIIYDINHPAFKDSLTFWWWIALSLLCPPMAFLSWIMIRKYPGKPRYFGFWIRFGADVGQLASLSAFLTVISSDIDIVAAEIYAAQIMTAVWWFIIFLIIRDSWKLSLTERVASAIEQRKVNGHDE